MLKKDQVNWKRLLFGEPDYFFLSQVIFTLRVMLFCLSNQEACYFLCGKEQAFLQIIKWSALKKKVLSIHNLQSTVREIGNKWQSQKRNMSKNQIKWKPVIYDGPNGSFFYFDTNSQFRLPNFEFRIPKSEFRIPHFEKKSCVWKFCFWRCHIRVRARGGARDLKLEQFKQ